MKLPNPGDGNFAPTPLGQYIVICTRFIDLGTQQGRNSMYGPKHKVLLSFEIPDVRIEYEDKQTGQMVNMPALQSERFTWTMSEKGMLRPFLESWRGRPFTDQDWGVFDIGNLIGVPARIQITHRHDNGNVYADISSIMSAGITRENWPQPEGPTIYYSIEDHDQTQWERLSDKMKAQIQQSPEWQAKFGNQGGQQGGYQGTPGPASPPPYGGHQGTHGGQMAGNAPGGHQSGPQGGNSGYGGQPGHGGPQGAQGGYQEPPNDRGAMFDDEIPF